MKPLYGNWIFKTFVFGKTKELFDFFKYLTYQEPKEISITSFSVSPEFFPESFYINNFVSNKSFFCTITSKKSSYVPEIVVFSTDSNIKYSGKTAVRR